MDPLSLIVQSGFSQASSGFFSAVLSPANEELSQVMRGDAPVWLPSIGDLLSLRNRDLLPEADCWDALAMQGVSMDERGDTVNQDKRTAAWQATLKGYRAWPTAAESIFYARRLGETGDGLFKWIVRAGGDKEEWKEWVDLLRGFLTVVDAVSLRNRGELDKIELENYLRKSNALDDDDIKRVDKLRSQIPPPSDLIHFAIREVFNPALAEQLGLYKEFSDNPDLKAWFGAQGLREVTLGPEFKDTKPLDVPLAYWASHWQLPSPTQAYEYLHRFRPDGGPNGAARNAKVTFEKGPGDDKTKLTLDSLLKASDYAPPWRPLMTEASYHVPGRVDIRRMYGLKVFGPILNLKQDVVQWGAAELEVAERFEDMGYADADGKLMAEFTIRQHWKAVNGKNQAKAVTRILSAFALGACQKAACKGNLTDAGLSPEEADQLLAQIDFDTKTLHLRAVLAAIRASVLSGAMNTDQGFAQLVNAGMDQIRANETRETWKVQLLGKWKELSASKVIDYVVRFIIVEAEADRRLANLGYQMATRKLMLEEARQKIAEKQDAVDRRSQAGQKSKDKEEQAKSKGQAKQKKDDALLATGKASTSTLGDWLQAGYITVESFTARLTNRGWRADDIAVLVDQLTTDGAPPPMTGPPFGPPP